MDDGGGGGTGGDSGSIWSTLVSCGTATMDAMSTISVMGSMDCHWTHSLLVYPRLGFGPALQRRDGSPHLAAVELHLIDCPVQVLWLCGHRFFCGSCVPGSS